MSTTQFEQNAAGTSRTIRKVREINNLLIDQHNRMQASLEQFSIPQNFMDEARKNNPYVSPYSR